MKTSAAKSLHRRAIESRDKRIEALKKRNRKLWRDLGACGRKNAGLLAALKRRNRKADLIGIAIKIEKLLDEIEVLDDAK